MRTDEQPHAGFRAEELACLRRESTILAAAFRAAPASMACGVRTDPEPDPQLRLSRTPDPEKLCAILFLVVQSL